MRRNWGGLNRCMQSRSSARVSLRRSADWAVRARCRARRFGAAFALQENSGSGLGNAFAGGAAAAEDVSTIWSNPAGMSRFATPQVAAAVHLVTPSFKFQRRWFGSPRHSSRSAARAATRATSPSSRISTRRCRSTPMGVGIGVNAPFGLSHRVRRQLARPLPGRQVGHQDDQRQSVGVLARQQHVRGGRRRQLAARRRRADEQGQLQRRRSRRPRDRRPPAD